jgi:SNF2 family DNA or RNA helicase
LKTHWADPRAFDLNENISKAYNSTLDELEQILNGTNIDASSIIGLMQQLRHHTGRVKILSLAVYVDNWFLEHPNEKLCIGIHHKIVREALAYILAHHKPLQMSDESPEVKDETEREFKTNPEHKLLIASIISAGTGRNFQFCRNAILAERQWNRSKEDQFCKRFHRIMRDSDGRVRTNFGPEDKVTVTTFNAVGYLDEYFDELVQLKGGIVDTVDITVDDEDILPPDSMIEIARKVIQMRKKYVGV